MRNRSSIGVWSFFVAIVAAVVVILTPAQAVAADFTVQATFPTYTINGAGNPTLTLTRGKTYTFTVSATGHPFFIKTAQVTGTGSSFDTGVTNNGVESGDLVFTVPSTAPATLFYQCAIHAPMTGLIQIVSPAVAATQPWLVALLGIAVLGAGVLVIRKRAALRRLALP